MVGVAACRRRPELPEETPLLVLVLELELECMQGAA